MTLYSGFTTNLKKFLTDEPRTAHMVMHKLTELDRPFLMRSDLTEAYAQIAADPNSCNLDGTPLDRLFGWAQETVVDGSRFYFALRTSVARWSYLCLQPESHDAREVPVDEFLAAKERIIEGRDPGQEFRLEVDFEPFSREFTKMQESRSIGRGVEFMNRRLSSNLFNSNGQGFAGLHSFLRVHRLGKQQLMLAEAIEDVPALRGALRDAEGLLDTLPADLPWRDFSEDLRGLGFEPGWGADVARVKDTMQLLLDVLEAPSPNALERFLARIPMIFSICILSPHGWFGQSGVLGRPDTGGQVVYILDQVRALEANMRASLAKQGLEIDPQILVVTRLIPDADETSCDQRIEAIAGTENARILRVPFREANGEIVPHWISRFEVWPYLERFAIDTGREVIAELRSKPDLFLGNYSDGNLVASLLSHRMRVTQCNIAHALEKTKYLLSDMYWRDNEDQYHFSCQFTADLIAMNAADFIIASTYQEIAGTPNTIGQYEAHMAFTMPGLQRVVHGIDVFDPKFNIVSPGVDPTVYFSTDDEERRLKHLLPGIEQQVFGGPQDDVSRGRLTDTGKPLIFSMARLDKVKNLAGFIDWYGRSTELRGAANVLLAAGYLDPARSSDDEEKYQIELMHRLIDEHDLEENLRWIEGQVDRERNGELYRFIADRRGAFVQPALFEAFGLTVIEAMSTGLPTFATCFGGPLEIIEEDVSGYHIDPNHGDRAAAKMAEFFVRCQQNPEEWSRISRGALDRVAARYTWSLYAERLMTLAKVYGFWRHVSDLERAETRRYLEVLYGLQYRPLAEGLAGD